MKKSAVTLSTLCLAQIAAIQCTPKKLQMKEAIVFGTVKMLIPIEFSNKGSDGSWTSYGENLNSFKFDILPRNGKNIEIFKDEILSSDKREIMQDISLVKTHTIAVAEYTGSVYYFEKDNNAKGTLPVKSYYSIAALGNADHVLTFKVISMQRSLTESLDSTIKSIQIIESADSAKASTHYDKGIVESLKKEGYQVYPKENMAVKCNCKLKNKQEHINSQKKDDVSVLLKALMGEENPGSYDKGVIYYINVHDLTKDITKLPPLKRGIYSSSYIQSYKSQLQENNIDYREIKMLGQPAIEYSLDINGLPVKSIVFINGHLAYALQVAARQNLHSKFNSFKQSFKFINS